MLSIEHEDPLLNGEVGVTRSLSVVKNAREELLANEPNPGASAANATGFTRKTRVQKV
jgi:hypothetical protein